MKEINKNRKNTQDNDAKTEIMRTRVFMAEEYKIGSM